MNDTETPKYIEKYLPQFHFAQGWEAENKPPNIYSKTLVEPLHRLCVV
jgi:hypothetical protein